MRLQELERSSACVFALELVGVLLPSFRCRPRPTWSVCERALTFRTSSRWRRTSRGELPISDFGSRAGCRAAATRLQKCRQVVHELGNTCVLKRLLSSTHTTHAFHDILRRPSSALFCINRSNPHPRHRQTRWRTGTYSHFNPRSLKASSSANSPYYSCSRSSSNSFFSIQLKIPLTRERVKHRVSRRRRRLMTVNRMVWMHHLSPPNGLIWSCDKCVFSLSARVYFVPIVCAKVVESYRSRLRDDLPGLEGDEVLRRRVEDFANQVRPTGFLVSIALPFVKSIPNLDSLYHRIQYASIRWTWAFLRLASRMRVRRVHRILTDLWVTRYASISR